jgi:Spy/CpxP family protein refolding chaperone
MIMNIFSNNRTIFWILMFLVLINITALATYFIYMRKPTNEPLPGSGVKRGIVLRQELSLTPEQSLEVNKINATYQASSEPIVEAIRQKKAELLDQLAKEKTDSAILTKLTEDIVIEQKKLQMANIKQFLDLKKVCTPEQTFKLAQIYAGLYGFEQSGKGQGKGMKYRHRFGQQKSGSGKPAN